MPWSGSFTDESRAKGRRTAQFAAAGLITAATLIAIIAVGLRRGNDDARAFQPPGNEFPIADLGPATRHDGRAVTLTELSRDVGVAEKGQVTVEVLVQYQGGESPVEVRCIQEDNSGLCVPDHDETGVSVYRTAAAEGDRDRVAAVQANQSSAGIQLADLDPSQQQELETLTQASLST